MNEQDTFLWGLQVNDSPIIELTVQMTIIMLNVAITCFIYSIAYNYLYYGVNQLLISDENKSPDLMGIAHCFVLIFYLSLYTSIAKIAVGTLEIINEAMPLGSVRVQEFAAFLDRSTEEQHTIIADNGKTALEAEVAAGEDPESAIDKELQGIDQGNKIDESASTLKQISQILNPANSAVVLLHTLAALLVGAARTIILDLGVVVVKTLTILGPSVFAFSILPVFQKWLSDWFDTLCSVGIVFAAINILSQIMWFIFKSIYDSGALNTVDKATKQLQCLDMDLTLVGSYCCCLWLASKIVGHGDAGKAISKIVSIVTTATTTAIVRSAIAGGATNIRAAASLGKGAIDSEE